MTFRFLFKVLTAKIITMMTKNRFPFRTKVINVNGEKYIDLKSYNRRKSMLIVILTIFNIFILNGLIDNLQKMDFSEKITVVNAQTPIEERKRQETQISAPEEVIEWDGIAEMSAYTSRIEETDASPCIGADNTNICEFSGCAVATNDYPFGTKIEIEDLGICVVKDVMAKRYTGTGNMDVYFGMDLKGAKKFGRKNLNYRIIN